MKAIRFEAYGGPDVLELVDIDTPTVGDQEVLVEVKAIGVNYADLHVVKGNTLFRSVAVHAWC